MASTEVKTAAPLLDKSLDKLPGQVNAVLVQLGKLLRHQTRPELKVIDRQKFQAHEALAKITRQFHDSLDEVENEILNAKAVLERDLIRIQTRRPERERIQQAIASKAMPDENAVQDQDVQMQDFADANPIQNQSPEDEVLDVQPDTDLPESDEVHNDIEHDVVSGNEPIHDIKEATPDDDDLFGGGHDEFGPDGGVTNFDFTAGGDFDMDFAMPAEGTNTAITNVQSASDTVTTNNAAASQNLAHNDLLLQDFGDINSAEDMHANGFGDLDFGNVDETHDEAHNESNPFGSINTEDDEFNSFFDV